MLSQLIRDQEDLFLIGAISLIDIVQENDKLASPA